MVEINTYYSKRYEAQANIMKRLVLICIPLLILAVLMQKGKIPQRLGGALISAVLVIGVIMVGSLSYDLMKRDKMNFDKYTCTRKIRIFAFAGRRRPPPPVLGGSPEEHRVL